MCEMGTECPVRVKEYGEGEEEGRMRKKEWSGACVVVQCVRARNRILEPKPSSLLG